MDNLMDQARAQRGAQPAEAGGAGDAGDFQKPDITQFTPPELQDTVQRIIAAGAKLMYSPEMRDELKQAVSADAPIDQKLADNVVGLTLILDKQAPNGIPAAALFPAAMGLLGEAAEALQAAGQQVTQDDFSNAALRMFVVIGKKLGGTDEQIMGAAQQFTGEGQPGAAPTDAAAGQMQSPDAASEGTPADDQQDGGSPTAEQDEMAGMQRGMQ